jgi:tRNA pseudouridine38-40 synthase
VNYRLILEYDGSRYHGWQFQDGLLTVEGELRRALQCVTGEVPRLTAAGRTDAGVHALGQCVNFRLVKRMLGPALQAALNAHLPADIVVREAEQTSDAFHARYSARTRQYRYRVTDQAVRPAVGRQYVWHVRQRLDVERMQEAAATLIGRHDLASFGRSPLPGASTVRTVHALDVRRRPDGLIEVDAVADAFLYGMMRRIVWALVAVGSGRLDPHQLRAVVGARRVFPGSAPPAGLIQVRVDYGEQETRCA